MNKGNYYRLKTRDWLRAQGFAVEVCEKLQRVQTKDKDGKPKVVFIKRDLFGADLIAMGGPLLAVDGKLATTGAIIFVNAKLGRKNVAAGIKEFAKYPFPDYVKRWLVVWEPRAREPEVIEAG